MKKIVSFLIVISLCLSAGLTLVSCGDKDTHEHTYQTEWSYDDTHHWHACSGENCNEKSGKNSHSYADGNNSCSVCGYKKSEDTNNALTEAEWQAAFNGENFKNVTLTIEQNFNGEVSGYTKSVMLSQVTETVIFEDYKHYNDTNSLVQAFQKYAFASKADDSLMLGGLNSDGNFEAADGILNMTFSEYYTAYISGLPKHIVDLENLYQKFEFDDAEACYIAIEPIVQTVDLGDGETHSVDYTIFKIWFSNGKLSKIYVECDEMTATLTYSDYDATMVDIPEVVKNEAAVSSNFQSIRNACEKFADYHGDITISYTNTESGEGQSASSTELISYNADTKEAVGSMQFQEGTVWEKIFFNGEGYSLYQEMQQDDNTAVSIKEIGELAIQTDYTEGIFELIDSVALVETLDEYISIHNVVFSEMFLENDDEYAKFSFVANVEEDDGKKILCVTLDRSELKSTTEIENDGINIIEIYFIANTKLSFTIETANETVVGFDITIINTNSPVEASSLRTIESETVDISGGVVNIQYLFDENMFNSLEIKQPSENFGIAGTTMLSLSDSGSVYVNSGDKKERYSWQGETVEDAYNFLLSQINADCGLGYATASRLYLDESCTVELLPNAISPTEWVKIDTVYIKDSDLNFNTVSAGNASVRTVHTACARPVAMQDKAYRVTKPIREMFDYYASLHTSNGDSLINLSEQAIYEFNTDDLSEADEVYVNGKRTNSTYITLESGKVYIIEFVTYK